MKIFSMTVLAIVTTMAPTTLLAETPLTLKVEANKTIAAGSINPPNPRDSCDLAKKAATEKAANMGFKGRVVWDKLSVDNDCKVSTTTAGHAGVFYTFTARGTFNLK
jgi:hypothetical protein